MVVYFLVPILLFSSFMFVLFLFFFFFSSRVARSYWTYVLMNLLRDYKGELSIRLISNMTAIKTEDIISTLQSLNLIRYWKGQHVIAVARTAIEECMGKSSRFKLCKPECLTWPVELEE